MSITINMDKAKTIGHKLRREKRESELAPLDAQVNHAVGNDAQVATLEARRQVIRDKYAKAQEDIDAASTTNAIMAALGA